jgi:hypothetical protein
MSSGTGSEITLILCISSLDTLPCFLGVDWPRMIPYSPASPMDKKKKTDSKKADKKKVKLRDISTSARGLTAEQARNVKGGDEPPPPLNPTKLP